MAYLEEPRVFQRQYQLHRAERSERVEYGWKNSYRGAELPQQRVLYQWRCSSVPHAAGGLQLPVSGRDSDDLLLLADQHLGDLLLPCAFGDHRCEWKLSKQLD